MLLAGCCRFGSAMQGKLTKIRVFQLLLVLFILLGLVLWRTLSAGSSVPAQTNRILAGGECDLSSADCRLPPPDELLVSSSLRPIVPETPFTLTLRGHPSMAPKHAWLEGRSMFMGRIPLSFSRQGDAWVASTMVGACSEPAMIWQLTIVLEDGQQLTAPFRVNRQ